MAFIEANPSSGSGTKILLYEYAGDSLVGNTPMVCSDSLLNYDTIIIEACENTERHDVEGKNITLTIPLVMLPVAASYTGGDSVGFIYYRGSSTHQRLFWIDSTDTTKLMNFMPNPVNNKDWVVRKVWGIK